MENYPIRAALSVGKAMLASSEILWDKQSLPGAASLTSRLSIELSQLVVSVIFTLRKYFSVLSYRTAHLIKGK